LASTASFLTRAAEIALVASGWAARLEAQSVDEGHQFIGPGQLRFEAAS
jgi:hypothetical protein